MKVKELIEMLKEVDGEVEVKIGMYYGYGDDLFKGGKDVNVRVYEDDKEMLIYSYDDEDDEDEEDDE